MKFDTSKDGLNTLFQPYQATILEHIWEINKNTRTGLASRQVYQFLQESADPDLRKSRASVINFLNNMVDEGVLKYETASGKGGFYRIYYPKLNRKQFAKYVTETITDKLHEVFSKQSRAPPRAEF